MLAGALLPVLVAAIGTIFCFRTSCWLEKLASGLTVICFIADISFCIFASRSEFVAKTAPRSEERRVGKECKARVAPHQVKTEQLRLRTVQAQRTDTRGAA